MAKGKDQTRMGLLEQIKAILRITTQGAVSPASAPQGVQRIELERRSWAEGESRLIKQIDDDPSLVRTIFESATRRIDRQIELAHEIEQFDDHIRGTLSLRRAAVLRLDATVKAGNPDDPRSVKAAAIAGQLIEEPWFYAASDWLLGAVLKQWAACEVQYRTESNLWTPVRIREVEPGRWHFNLDNRPQFFRDLASRTESDVLPALAGKYMLHSVDANSKPGDMCLARAIAKLWHMNRINVLSRGIVLERWGVPTVAITYQQGLSDEEVQSIVDSIYELALQRVIATPTGTTVEMQEQPDSSPHIDEANDYRRAISRCLLGQDSSQTAIEGQKTGATLQGQVRDDIRDQDARRLDASQNETFFAPWCAWNFGPDVKPPRICRTLRETPDPEARGRVFKIAGELGLPIKREQVYSDLGIHVPGDGDDVLVGAGLFAAASGPPDSAATATDGSRAGGDAAARATPVAGDGTGRADPLSGIQITSAMDILARLRQATLEAVPAEELLVALGFDRALAAKMVAATPVGRDDSEADRAFKRDVVRSFLADGTSNDVLYNAIEITKLISEVNLPLEPDYLPPWLPVVAQPGQEVTGDVVKDAEGDIVGGDAEEAPAASPGASAEQKDTVAAKARSADPTSDSAVTAASNVWGSIFKGHTKQIRAVAEEVAAGDGSDAEKLATFQRRLPELLDAFNVSERADLLAKAQLAALGRGVLDMHAAVIAKKK